MTKIPIIRSRDISELGTPKGMHILKESSVEVVYVPYTGGVIQLIFENDLSDLKSLCLPLSPPTAIQLCRALKQAVKDYLNYNPETEPHLTDDQD